MVAIKSPIKVLSQGINIDLFVQPGTSQNKFAGLYADRLKVKVTAKAIDGAANEAVIKLIAKYFEIPKNAVQIIRGLTAREKTIALIGNPADLKVIADKLLLL